MSQKNDRPYGIAELEDYNDTYQLRLWGNDFVNFKNYFTPGMSLMIKATVEEWVSQKDNRRGLDLKIKGIHMLSEVRRELVRSIRITLPAEAVNDTFIDNISQFMVKPDKDGKAKHLKFQIVDTETNMKIDLFSRTNYIDLSDHLFSFLEEAEELSYSLT